MAEEDIQKSVEAAELAALDALFDEVAAQPVPGPDADLMARLVADAQAAQVLPQTVMEQPAPGWRGLIEMIGGWPALGGIAMAGVAGVWIGVAPPDVLDDAIASLLGGSVSLELTELGGAFGLEG